MSDVVHYLGCGHTACMRPGPPVKWPAGHKWSNDWVHVNCPDCLKGKAPVETFFIAPDGLSITCKRCRRTSYSLDDVKNHYCGFCHILHDDLWPPARQWWIEQGGPVMPEEQQNKCVALLLAIAFDGKSDKGTIQTAVKKFLGEIPEEMVARAAGTPIIF